MVSRVTASWASPAMSVTLAKSDCTVGVSVGFVTVTGCLAVRLQQHAFQAAACCWCWPLTVVAKVATAGGTVPSFPAVAAQRPAV